MEIKIKTIKFDADQKLIEYVEKKVSKLDKFFKGAADVAEVTLSLLSEPDNKQAKIQMHVKGEDLIIERNSSTFEQAITDCADAMKEKLTRKKEKTYDI